MSLAMMWLYAWLLLGVFQCPTAVPASTEKTHRYIDNRVALECPESLTQCDCITVIYSDTTEQLINCTHRHIQHVPVFLELTGYSFDELNMGHNDLQSLSKNAFQGPGITRLNLRHNRIRSVSDNAFMGVYGVTELDMDDNELVSAPVSLRYLTNLTKLSFKNNNIHQLAKSAFELLTELEELELSGNPVEFASPFVAFDGLSNLRILRLERCYMPNLPLDVLKHVTNLEFLDIKKNNITSIPAGVFDDVPKIRELDLEGNAITLTDFREFEVLRGLKVLKLSHCHMTNISATTMKYVPRLHTLVLRHCHIHNVIRGPFRNSFHLSKVDLSGNPKVAITDNLFQGLEDRLKYIGIENMNLTSFPARALRKLFVLKKIKANRNPIQYLPESVFKGLKGNKPEIHLDKCEIFNISSGFLLNAKKNTKVSLRDNDITSLDFLVEEPCQFYGHNLDLSGNPIVCDCELAAVLELKAFTILGNCQGSNSFTGLELAPEFSKHPEAHHLEMTAAEQCPKDVMSLFNNTANMRYDCNCRDWLNLDSDRTCAGQSSPSTDSRVIFTAAVAVTATYVLRLM